MRPGVARLPERAEGWIEDPAPAKLNLYLHVVGRRTDGYHLLDSLVAFASIGDRVRVAAAPRLGFTAAGRFAADVPSGDAAEDNLAVRAARLLADAIGRPPDVAIHLCKALPAAAGLGGGSADAAATLRALAALWGIAGDDRRLHDLACRLGADVPVCLAARTSHIGGIGEQVDPAPSLAGAPVVLANPNVPVSTPDVFRAFEGAFSKPEGSIDPPRDPAPLAGWLADRRNDLAGPAERLCPVIGTVTGALSGAPGCLLARMSGSGATCFGLFDTPVSADRAVMRLQAAHPDWWVEGGRLV